MMMMSTSTSTTTTTSRTTHQEKVQQQRNDSIMATTTTTMAPTTTNTTTLASTTTDVTTTAALSNDAFPNFTSLNTNSLSNEKTTKRKNGQQQQQEEHHVPWHTQQKDNTTTPLEKKKQKPLLFKEKKKKKKKKKRLLVEKMATALSLDHWSAPASSKCACIDSPDLSVEFLCMHPPPTAATTTKSDPEEEEEEDEEDNQNTKSKHYFNSNSNSNSKNQSSTTSNSSTSTTTAPPIATAARYQEIFVDLCTLHTASFDAASKHVLDERFDSFLGEGELEFKRVMLRLIHKTSSSSSSSSRNEEEEEERRRRRRRKALLSNTAKETSAYRRLERMLKKEMGLDGIDKRAQLTVKRMQGLRRSSSLNYVESAAAAAGGGGMSGSTSFTSLASSSLSSSEEQQQQQHQQEGKKEEDAVGSTTTMNEDNKSMEMHCTTDYSQNNTFNMNPSSSSLFVPSITTTCSNPLSQTITATTTTTTTKETKTKTALSFTKEEKTLQILTRKIRSNESLYRQFALLRPSQHSPMPTTKQILALLFKKDNNDDNDDDDDDDDDLLHGLEIKHVEKAIQMALEEEKEEEETSSSNQEQQTNNKEIIIQAFTSLFRPPGHVFVTNASVCDIYCDAFLCPCTIGIATSEGGILGTIWKQWYYQMKECNKRLLKYLRTGGGGGESEYESSEDEGVVVKQDEKEEGEEEEEGDKLSIPMKKYSSAERVATPLHWPWEEFQRKEEDKQMCTRMPRTPLPVAGDVTVGAAGGGGGGTNNVVIGQSFDGGDEEEENSDYENNIPGNNNHHHHRPRPSSTGVVTTSDIFLRGMTSGIASAQEHLSALMETVRQFVRIALLELRKHQPTPRSRRERYLLALPVVGTGGGRAGDLTGQIVETMLRVLCEEVGRSDDVDCVLVCADVATYSHAQSVRWKMCDYLDSGGGHWLPRRENNHGGGSVGVGNVVGGVVRDFMVENEENNGEEQEGKKRKRRKVDGNYENEEKEQWNNRTTTTTLESLNLGEEGEETELFACFRILTPRMRDDALQLAKIAARGHLSMFIGAGVSMGAGLPSWKDLLLGVEDQFTPNGLPSERMLGNDFMVNYGKLDPLGMADWLGILAASRPDREGQRRDIKERIARLIEERSQHPSLLMSLLTSLPCKSIVTQNYDRLIERAYECRNVAENRALAKIDGGRAGPAGGRGGNNDIGRSRSSSYDGSVAMEQEQNAEALSVIPYAPVRGADRWLLKMHGCVSSPESIVITSDDYRTYESGRKKALAGLVQANLMTSHLLFVGFSLTDPNYLRIIEEVRHALKPGHHVTS